MFYMILAIIPPFPSIPSSSAQQLLLCLLLAAAATNQAIATTTTMIAFGLVPKICIMVLAFIPQLQKLTILGHSMQESPGGTS